MRILTVSNEAQARLVHQPFYRDAELIVDVRHLSSSQRDAIARANLSDDALFYLEIAAAHCATIVSRETFLAETVA